MAYRHDENTPYWLSTIPTVGLDDDPPKTLSDMPLELLLSGQLARALSEASNPRIRPDMWPFPRLPSHMLPLAPPSNPSTRPAPANMSTGPASPPTSLAPSFAPAPVEHLDSAKYWGSPPEIPEAPSPSSAHGFHVSPAPQAPSWDTVPTPPADSAAQGFSPPPSPPSWDTAVSPVEYPDLARYWGALPPPPAADERTPAASPTQPWVRESSALKTVPRALTPADLGRRSRDAENVLALARIFAPDLVDYLTTPAPPPQYTPNAAGKIPPIGYHPNEAGAGVDALLNIMSLPTGGLGKVAATLGPLGMARWAALPAAERAAGLARARKMGFRTDMPIEYAMAPEGEKIASAAINVNGRIFTGPTHAHAIESAERALGLPFERMEQAPIFEGFVTDAGRYISRWEAGDIARRSGQGAPAGFFGATRGLAAERTAMAAPGTSPPAPARTAATAPGLPGGQGVWGWVLPEEAVSSPASPLSPRTPPRTAARQTSRSAPQPPEPPHISLSTPQPPGSPETSPLWHRAQRPASMDVRRLADHEIQANLMNAWEQGHDSVLLRNYTSPGGSRGNVLVVKDPTQLRSPYAKFNPAKRNSRDLLASGAGIASAGAAYQLMPVDDDPFAPSAFSASVLR